VDDHLFELKLGESVSLAGTIVPQLLDVAACDEGGDL
jgi:hypothetical protein